MCARLFRAHLQGHRPSFSYMAITEIQQILAGLLNTAPRLVDLQGRLLLGRGLNRG